MESEIFQEVAALRSRVVEPVAARYPGKEELVELLALALAAGENLLIVGPPGSAKSELVSELASRLGGRCFEYLLTRFTEPSEIFGPVDIRKLREGTFAVCTEGMLPEAEIAFLDEIFNASSAILNTLLGILNEGVFRRGIEVRRTRLISVFGATNRLSDDPSLAALLDRFTLRVEASFLGEERLEDLLRAGWSIEQERLRGGARVPGQALGIESLGRLHAAAAEVDLEPIRRPLIDLVRRIRACGLFLSDRRAVKLQRLAAASAVLSGRSHTLASDLWPVRYLWEGEEDQESIAAIAAEVLARGEIEDADRKRGGMPHPLAHPGQRATELLGTLEKLEEQVERLETRAPSDALDRLHNEIVELDARARWCRARSGEEESELRRIEERLDSLAEALGRKEGEGTR